MTIHVSLGRTLKSEKVYYECRNLRKPKQQSLTRKVSYIGKLNSIFAFCVDFVGLYRREDVKEIAEREETVGALQGKVISYTCLDKPKDPVLFQRTHSHRGVWGYLSNNVFCVIEVSLYPS